MTMLTDEGIRKIRWECPDCGCKNIVMRTVNAIVITPILGIDEECGDIVFNKVDEEIVEMEGDRYFYECAECNHIIVEGYDEDFINAVQDITDELADGIELGERL